MKRSTFSRLKPLSSFIFVAIFLAMVLSRPGMALAGETSSSFAGAKMTWHVFNRYDFVMDMATLSMTPFKAPPNKGDGVGALKGHCCPSA